MAMSSDSVRQRAPHVPFLVPLLNPIAHRLLRIGIPMGPNALLTVRGRKTGQPHPTPVALVETGARRGSQSPVAEVNWACTLLTVRDDTPTINPVLHDVH